MSPWLKKDLISIRCDKVVLLLLLDQPPVVSYSLMLHINLAHASLGA